MSEVRALQLPGTLMERLQACVGMPVTVYLRGVHGSLAAGIPGMSGTHPGPGVGPGVPCPGMGPGLGPGFGPGTGTGPGFGAGPGRPTWPGVSSMDNVEAMRNLRGPCPDPRPPCPDPRPPCPCPEPGKGMMTTVVQGVLVFVGADYLAVAVGYGGKMTDLREVTIPLPAIGMIICEGEPLM